MNRCCFLGHDWRFLKDEPGYFLDDGPYSRKVPQRCQRCGKKGFLAYVRRRYYEDHEAQTEGAGD